MEKPRLVDNKYILNKKTDDNSLSSIWKGENQETGEQVRVTILKKNTLSRHIEDLIRFKQEIQITAGLAHPHISPVLDSGNTSLEFYIISPYSEGTSLKDYLDKKRPFTIKTVLDLGIQLCKALSCLHSHSIFHKNIKPDTIQLELLDGNTGKIHLSLIGSGVSHIILFDKLPENELIQNFNYFSPEQCSTLKKEIDERSDLYSLGVLLYQMLTGSLPFESEDVTKLIYKHIAVLPENPRKKNEKIPLILEKLVLRLLEKEPENRYQHAAGVMDDLIRIFEGKENFKLGFTDIPNKLTYKTGMIDRTRELESIKEIIDNVLLGSGSLCVVSGDTGTGKTRVLRQTKKYLFEKNVSYVSIKCHPGTKSGPFQTFKKILQTCIKYIFDNKTEKEIDTFKNILKNRFHIMGQIILKLNPEFKELIGTFPPITLSDENRDFSRFYEIIKDFLVYFTEVEKYLIIIIDDLQWIDSGSLDILFELSTDIEQNPFLFIVSMKHDTQLFDLLKQKAIPVKNILLENFDEGKTNTFLSLLLHQPEDILKEITSYVFQRSKGNPFFTVELVKHLVEKGGLARKNRKWFLDSLKLKTFELPRTLLDVTIQKVSLLSNADKNILAYASVIGSVFDLEVLFNISRVDNVKIVGIIDKARFNGFLTEDKTQKGILLFSHEQLRKLFYHSLAEEKRQAIHIRIARLYENIYADVLEDYLYEVAYHYYEGKNYSSAKVYMMNAAKKAEKNYANSDVIEFCRLVISIEEKAGKKGSLSWLESMEQMGRIFMVTGKLDAAFDIFNQVMPLLETTSEKLVIYRLLSNIDFKKGDLKNAERNARLGLAIIKKDLPKSKAGIFFSTMKNLFFHGLNILCPWRPHIFKSGLKKEDTINVIWLYWVLHSIYALEGSWETVSTALQMLIFAHTNIGPSKELGMAFMVYGLTQAELTFFNSAERNHLRALAMRTKYKDDWGIAHSNINMGFMYKIKGDFKKAIEYFTRGNKIYSKIGDVGHGTLGAGISGLAGAYLFISEYDNAKRILDEYALMTAKMNSYWGQVFAGMHYTTLYSELGDWDQAEKYGLKALDTAKEKQDAYLICISQISLGRAYYEKGDMFNAKSHLEEGLELYRNNPKLLLEYVISVYPYLAEVYIREHWSGTFANNQDKQRSLRVVKYYCDLAFKKTRKWKVHHCIALRAKAKYYSLCGRHAKSARFFNKSINLCEEMDRKYELAETISEYGCFFKSIGKFNPAKEKFENAYTVFKEIGARDYEKRMASLLGIQENTETSSDRYIENRKYYQRLNTLISLSRDISSILNLQELMDLTISKAIEVSSAYRGYIFLINKQLGRLHFNPDNSVEPENPIVYCSKIVEVVFNRRKAVVESDVSKNKVFAENPVVLKHGLKSIICVPILHGNNIEGVCYLDNPLSVGVFSEDDVELLNVLMSQVAISIENARNYDKIDELNRSLEKKVTERTTELQQANRELSIKNKFKSNFLASMSHEIRTPLNSILGFNQQLLYETFDSLQDILEINDEIIEGLQDYKEEPEVREILSLCERFNTFFDDEISINFYHLLLLKEGAEKLKNTGALDDAELSGLEEKLKEQEDILTEEEKSVKNNLQRIQKSGEYLLQLVNSILDISKIEAGKINLVIEEVKIRDFIDDIVTTAFSYRSAKGKDGKVEILFSMAEDIPHTLLLDGKKIKQVLLNLISNAIKFTEKGQVRLECYLCDESSKICFSVSDTGMGIPKDEISAIFNEFERTKNAMTIEGTGLGLALSKRLVELHQGTIGFESELGKGSTFFTKLPLRS